MKASCLVVDLPWKPHPRQRPGVSSCARGWRSTTKSACAFNRTCVRSRHVSGKEPRKELVVLAFEAGSREKMAQERKVTRSAVDYFLSGCRPPRKTPLKVLVYERVVMYRMITEPSGPTIC
jgi:hypothetical protein